MNTSEILTLMLDKNDAGAATVGEYLCALLEAVWTEGEDFNSKKPFGNSGWETFIQTALIRNHVVSGKFDEDGYVEGVDYKAVDEIIVKCLRDLFGVTESGE